MSRRITGVPGRIFGAFLGLVGLTAAFWFLVAATWTADLTCRAIPGPRALDCELTDHILGTTHVTHVTATNVTRAVYVTGKSGHLALETPGQTLTLTQQIGTEHAASLFVAQVDDVLERRRAQAELPRESPGSFRWLILVVLEAGTLLFAFLGFRHAIVGDRDL
jgi:hypothetical protein